MPDLIKSYETQRVNNSMINALVKQEIERQNCARIAELEAEVARLREELELRKQKDRYVYTRFLEDAEQHYAEPDPGTRLGRIGWALIGWAVLAFGALFDGLGV